MNVLVAILYAVIAGYFVGQQKPARLIYVTLQHARKKKRKTKNSRYISVQINENRAK